MRTPRAHIIGRLALVAVGALTLGGCVTDGYGGMSVGSGGYYDPWNDGSAYGYGYPSYGWYDNYYYPGRGYYVYDRGGKRHRMNDRHRQHWLADRGDRRDWDRNRDNARDWDRGRDNGRDWRRNRDDRAAGGFSEIERARERGPARSQVEQQRRERFVNQQRARAEGDRPQAARNEGVRRNMDAQRAAAAAARTERATHGRTRMGTRER